LLFPTQENLDASAQVNHIWNILNFMPKASSSWSGKTLYFFFHKFFPETFVATSAVLWIDVRETQQDTGCYGKNHNRSSNEQDLKTVSSRTWQVLLCSTTSTAMHLFQNTTMASAQRLSNVRWDQHTACRVLLLVFRDTSLSVETAMEKWCKRRRLRGQDKTIGVYLQKS